MAHKRKAWYECLFLRLRISTGITSFSPAFTIEHRTTVGAIDMITGFPSYVWTLYSVTWYINWRPYFKSIPRSLLHAISSIDSFENCWYTYWAMLAANTLLMFTVNEKIEHLANRVTNEQVLHPFCQASCLLVMHMDVNFFHLSLFCNWMVIFFWPCLMGAVCSHQALYWLQLTNPR